MASRFLGFPKAGMLVSLCVLLLCVSSCDKSTNPTQCGDNPLTTICGYVLGAGEPVDARVKLKSCNDDFYSILKTETDSTGWYSLTLPSGDYTLELSAQGSYYYADSSLVHRYWDADTLHVFGDSLQLDFRGSAITIRLDVPDEPGDAYGGCWLEIEIEGRIWSAGHASRVDVEGIAEYHVSFVPSGMYWMRLTAGRNSQVWLPPTWLREDADPLLIGEGEHVHYAAELGEAARLGGMITGSWQEFAERTPTVDAYTADSTRLLTTLTDVDGAYEFLLPIPTSLKLSVEVNQIRQWIGGSDFASARLFEMNAGEIVTDASLVGGGIACQLKGPGEFVNHRASYELIDDQGYLLERRPRTGNGTREFFSNLVPGEYFLRVVPSEQGQPWLAQWFDGADSLAAATAIVISEPGGIEDVEIHLTAGGVIAGRVTHSGGGDATGMWISLKATDGSVHIPFAATTSMADGTFEIVGIENGSYWVGAYSSELGLRSWYPGTMEIERADTLHVVDHGTITGIDWRVLF